jgi:hypothetical protein
VEHIFTFPSASPHLREATPNHLADTGNTSGQKHGVFQPSQSLTYFRTYLASIWFRASMAPKDSDSMCPLGETLTKPLCLRIVNGTHRRYRHGVPNLNYIAQIKR